MSGLGKPNFEYLVFDYFKEPRDGYLKRVQDLQEVLSHKDIPSWVKILTPERVNCFEQLQLLFATTIEKGFEGLILRSGNSPYKYGRSTVREGYMIKMKLFGESEATILGMDEAQENTNPEFYDERGYTKRRTVKNGMVGKSMMGALRCRDLETLIEFNIGTGFDEETRIRVWRTQDDPSQTWIGKICKYRFQKTGEKVKPRMPVFVGLRSIEDMTPKNIGIIQPAPEQGKLPL